MAKKDSLGGARVAAAGLFKAKPKKKVKFVVKGGKLQLPGPVLFKSGSHELLPESDAVLDIVKQYLDAKKKVTKLRIEGHTDTDGADDKNLALSTARASAITAAGPQSSSAGKAAARAARVVSGAPQAQTARDGVPSASASSVAKGSATIFSPA